MEKAGSALNYIFLFFKQQDGIGEEVLKMSTEEIIQRTRLLDSEIKVGIQGRPGWSQLPPWGSMGTAVSSLGHKKRKEN